MEHKLYKLGNHLSKKEQLDLGVEPNPVSQWCPPVTGDYVAAIRTDNFRAPNKGEWYLSGATPVAYRAPNDLGINFRIMRLVAVTRTTTACDRIH